MPVLLLVSGLLGGCSPQAAPTEDPANVAAQFVKAYDDWAQTGFEGPIPHSLSSLASTDMVDVLNADQRWHVNGDVVQQGAVRIVEKTTIALVGDTAVVRIVLDATNVSVTAEGKPTFVDYSRPIVTQFILENRGGTWRVASTETDE